MKMNKKIPSGFKTKTLKETRESLKLCNVMAKIMEKYGFKLTAISALYPMSESFPRVGADDRFKLVDSTGDVLCVASEQVTGMLNATERDLERLCSFGEVYRFSGENRNELQFASLLAGFSGFEAECEMITSGISLMRELGVECGKIILTNTTILQGIAEVYLNGKADFDVIRRVLNGADYEFKTDTDIALKKLLLETAETKGNEVALQGVAEKLKNPTSASGIFALVELSKMLDELGYGNLVEFDLSIIGQVYDNGTLFKLCDAAGNVFIEGGRHDFFRDGGGVIRAVSFRVSPDSVLKIHPLLASVPQCDAVIAIADGIKALKCAYRLKNSLTDNNLSVTMLYRTGKAEAVEYANVFGIESVIYIDERGKIVDVERPTTRQPQVVEPIATETPVEVSTELPAEAPVAELAPAAPTAASEFEAEITVVTDEGTEVLATENNMEKKKTDKKPSAKKPEPKTETKPAQKAETKTAPKTAAKSAPKTATKSAPKAEPKTATKTAPKTVAKPEPKAEPKSSAKTAAKAAPKTESKSTSKTGAKKKGK